MTLIGLDLNATRARAVAGPMQSAPAALRLEEEQRDLPLVISLAERKPVAGRAGLSLCRKQPHLASQDFLPHLGGTRKWSAGRHTLDAAGALGLVFDRLQRHFLKAQGAVIALPAYLNETQIAQIGQVADRLRLNVLGSVPAALAAVRQAYQRRPLAGLALVADVDGAALTWSAVSTDGGHARVLESQSTPRLGRNAWLMQMLDFIAGRCIRLSRRDPRQIPDTEQALHDRLSSLLDSSLGTSLIEVHLRTPSWSQHLMLQPAELTACCAELVKQAVTRMHDCLAALPAHGAINAILLTAPAANLPGLATALEQGPGIRGQGSEEEGLAPGPWPQIPVQMLDADTVAVGAHEVAGLMHRGECPRGFLDTVPLPVPESLHDGPARLHFRGQDHPLVGPTFTLGWDPACNLVFEASLYPTVSPQHCDIILDRRVFTLRDRSRQGTLVNERPVVRQVALHSGDWIRLGPDGPVLRFLGQAVSLRAFHDAEER